MCAIRSCRGEPSPARRHAALGGLICWQCPSRHVAEVNQLPHPVLRKRLASCQSGPVPLFFGESGGVCELALECSLAALLGGRGKPPRRCSSACSRALRAPLAHRTFAQQRHDGPVACAAGGGDDLERPLVERGGVFAMRIQVHLHTHM